MSAVTNYNRELKAMVAQSLRGHSVKPLCDDHKPIARIERVDDEDGAKYGVAIACPNCHYNAWVHPKWVQQAEPDTWERLCKEAGVGIDFLR